MPTVSTCSISSVEDVVLERSIRKVMPLDSCERRGERHAPCEQSALSSQVLLFFRVAVLGFYAVCAHERLPVTRDIKESAVCYQGLCVESSTSHPSKKIHVCTDRAQTQQNVFVVCNVCSSGNCFCLDRALHRSQRLVLRRSSMSGRQSETAHSELCQNLVFGKSIW